MFFYSTPKRPLNCRREEPQHSPLIAWVMTLCRSSGKRGFRVAGVEASVRECLRPADPSVLDEPQDQECGYFSHDDADPGDLADVGTTDGTLELQHELALKVTELIGITPVFV